MRILVTIWLSFSLWYAGAAITVEKSVPDIISDKPETPSATTPAVTSFPGELTVEGLISLSNGNFCIQMGSFTRRDYAESLSAKLAEMAGLSVDVIAENGLFKVFINSSLRGSAPCLYIPVSFPVTAAGKSRKEDNHPPEGNYGTVAAVTQTDSVPQQTEVKVHRADTIIIEPDQQEQDSVQDGSHRRSFKNLFFLRGDSPWLTRYNYFGKSVALVNALIITIVFSVATMIILLVVILLNRTRMEKEAKLRQYLLEQYQALIIDYLFGDAGHEIFKPIASDFYRRQVLVEQMIDVSVNLKGDSGEKLTRLYKELELDKDSVQRARSRQWHLKIKGFRELAFMNIKEANDEMYKALGSKNEILRMEAQIALVRLSEKDPFEFLSHLVRPFSLWEQITLHDLIVQHDIPVPDFSRWLNSPNPTVVMFALRMIREFRQKEAEPELRRVLLHRDARVSQLAVQVAGDLDMRSTLETMKRMYKFQEYNNCLEIVRAMSRMPDESMMGFLKLVLDKEDDVQLQIEAVKAIENMGEEGVKALVKIMKSEYKNYNIIVRHVLDRRIY